MEGDIFIFLIIFIEKKNSQNTLSIFKILLIFYFKKQKKNKITILFLHFFFSRQIKSSWWKMRRLEQIFLIWSRNSHQNKFLKQPLLNLSFVVVMHDSWRTIVMGICFLLFLLRTRRLVSMTIKFYSKLPNTSNHSHE